MKSWMKIQDIPEFREKDFILSLPQKALLTDAVDQMVDHKCGSVVVTRDGTRKIVGIVTERDLMTKVIHNGLDYKSLKLEDIMTGNVKTARLDDSIFDSMKIMATGNFRHLPVVDEQDNIVGMLSQSDFATYTWEDVFKRLKEQTTFTLSTSYQPFLITLAVIIYTLIILFAFTG